MDKQDLQLLWSCEAQFRWQQGVQKCSFCEAVEMGRGVNGAKNVSRKNFEALGIFVSSIGAYSFPEVTLGRTEAP